MSSWWSQVKSKLCLRSTDMNGCVVLKSWLLWLHTCIYSFSLFCSLCPGLCEWVCTVLLLEKNFQTFGLAAHTKHYNSKGGSKCTISQICFGLFRKMISKLLAKASWCSFMRGRNPIAKELSVSIVWPQTFPQPTKILSEFIHTMHRRNLLVSISVSNVNLEPNRNDQGRVNTSDDHNTKHVPIHSLYAEDRIVPSWFLVTFSTCEIGSVKMTNWVNETMKKIMHSKLLT